MGLTDRRRAIVLFGDSLTQRSFEANGWGSSLAVRYGRRCDVYNRGFGGYNSRWCLSMLKEMFPEDETQLLVTIMLGTNDAALRHVEPAVYVPLDEYEKNLREIVKHCKKTAKFVVVMTPPCMNENQRLAFQHEKYGDGAIGTLDRTNENTRKYAGICTKVSRELGMPCVDLFKVTTAKQGGEENEKGKLSRAQSVDPWQTQISSINNFKSSDFGPPPRFNGDGDGRGGELFTDGIHFSEHGQQIVFQALIDTITQHIGDALCPENLDSDWPFGPALRSDPFRWKEKMRAHEKQAVFEPTLFGQKKKSSMKESTVTVSDSSILADKDLQLARGVAVLLAAAGAGYFFGARR